MSLIDKNWEVWDNEALTTDKHSFTADNFFDMEEGGVTDEGLGEIWFNVQVGTPAGGMASGAILSVITSDAVDFSSGLICLGALGSVLAPLTAAMLTAKARFSLAFPRWGLHKYLEVHWDVISEAATGLTVDVWFGMRPLCPTGRLQKMASGYTA
ncbi:MAG: hypothetical protein V2A79_10070 [Planctomycetota bacterium]